MPSKKLFVAALALPLLLATPVKSKEGVPDPVAKAAEVYARDVAGAIVCRTKMESQIKSPVYNRHSVMDSWVVTKDGVPVQTKIVSWRNDGKDVSKDEIQKQEAQTNAAYREGKSFFKPPYDRRYQDAYEFQVDSADHGQTVVRFTSAIKGEQHGSGSFTLDRDFRVRKLVFKPNVLPKNVDKGSFTLERNEVGAGLFGIKSLEMKYEGSMGLIKGGFVLEQQYEDYRRFKTLDEALSKGLAQ